MSVWSFFSESQEKTCCGEMHSQASALLPPPPPPAAADVVIGQGII